MSEQVRRVAVWAAAGLLTAALVVTSRSSAAVPTVAASRDLAAQQLGVAPGDCVQAASVVLAPAPRAALDELVPESSRGTWTQGGYFAGTAEEAVAALSDVQVGTPGDEAWAIVDGEQGSYAQQLRQVGRLSDGTPVWALADTVRKVACP